MNVIVFEITIKQKPQRRIINLLNLIEFCIFVLFQAMLVLPSNRMLIAIANKHPLMVISGIAVNKTR